MPDKNVQTFEKMCSAKALGRNKRKVLRQTTLFGNRNAMAPIENVV